MVYMAGDNNLSAAGDTDLVEMRRVGSSDRVNVLVEFDNAGDEGTRRIHVKKDGTGETVESLGDPTERAICSDDGSGHSIDTVELGYS